MKPTFKPSYTGRIVARLRAFPHLTAILHETRHPHGLFPSEVRLWTAELGRAWHWWTERPMPRKYTLGYKK